MDQYQSSFPFLSVDYLHRISSTSSFLKQKAKSTLEPSLCVTDIQTNGYGQRSSSWQSDDQSITFSLLLPINHSIDQLLGFSQLLALSINKSLTSYTKKEYKVKWPNDIYLADSKVSGLLVETVKCTSESCWLVIGVGVNTGSFHREFEDYSAKGVPLIGSQDKKFLTVQLITDLVDTVEKYDPSIWLTKKQIWNSLDYFKLNETVSLKGGPFELGYYLGISDSGSLLIGALDNEQEQNIVEITSGQVSVRTVRD